MSEPRQFDSLASVDLPPDAAVHLAIGMFDGVHRGHAVVLESAIRAAQGSGGLCGALTFWPHPSRLFRPGDPARMILGPELKRRELARHGLDFIVEQPFNRAFSEIEAKEFLNTLKAGIPGLASIHAGENWRFGRDRAGDMNLLVALGQRTGARVEVVGCVSDGAERISSTRIRSLLTQGRVEEANALLGFDYYTIGTVTQGKRMGRALDAPTLNLPFEGDLMPAYGVYAVKVSDVAGARSYRGVANFGVRPTVDISTKPLLEVHLLDPCVFDYGHRLKVVWLRFLRQERKFDGLESLKRQIERDVEQARRWFEEA